jgi:hypothetical protein
MAFLSLSDISGAFFFLPAAAFFDLPAPPAGGVWLIIAKLL